MKAYGDEKFIQVLRDAQENARNTKIREGSVLVEDKELLFEEREILKDRMWMWLPEDFKLLSEEYAELKYPNGRPDLIYSNPETTVNVSFTYEQEKLAAGEETEVCDSIGQIIQNLYPTSGVLNRGTVQAGENEIAWIDFLTPAIDGSLYNMIFVGTLKGRMLMGTCNCPEEDKDDWTDLFVQMLETIRMA